MTELNFHVAVQVCDTASRDSVQRFCGPDRSKLTRKSTTSFFESVSMAMSMLDGFDLKPTVSIFNDHSTADTRAYLDLVKEHYSKKGMTINIVDTAERGLMSSIRACYDFLEQQGQDIVYQVQDDFLFSEDAIYQMIEVFVKTNHSTGAQPIVLSHHHPYYFGTWYAYKSTPRVIIPGSMQYWIQSYELGCTFLTGKKEFSRHWDLYEKFFSSDPKNTRLEVDTMNRITMRTGSLALVPAVSVGLHMQDETDRDTYVDWKPIWNRVPDLRAQ